MYPLTRCQLQSQNYMNCASNYCRTRQYAESEEMALWENIHSSMKIIAEINVNVLYLITEIRLVSTCVCNVMVRHLMDQTFNQS